MFIRSFVSLFSVLIICFSNAKDFMAMSKYTIKPGDTLWKISVLHSVELDELIRINPQVNNPELIYPGQMIFVPGVGKQINIEQQKMLSLLNDERKKRGLAPVYLDPRLSMIAEKKSVDMRVNKYVAHTSPSYGNPTTMLETFQIPFKQVLENVGAGPKTAEEMVLTWMNSQVTMNNILDKNATHVGIGYAKGGLHGHYWTTIMIETK
ncbi:CAP domain-containing protein [Neobacillus sp. LXY-4]|uniref:CAP domain-containing protein n=1 Tax=Neobacillus sp. LXY-4 TaxID=3379826 RepID=UPI003EE0F0E1